MYGGPAWPDAGKSKQAATCATRKPIATAERGLVGNMKRKLARSVHPVQAATALVRPSLSVTLTTKMTRMPARIAEDVPLANHSPRAAR
jgi:hypothetical protein